MRYMMLIYSREDEAMDSSEREQVAAAHGALISEASRRGLLCSADPLDRSSTATTVRIENGKVRLLDGPFAETKEQLAGYYILDCEDLDEAIEWAARIPTSCQGGSGCVEVRPIRQVRPPEQSHARPSSP